MLKQKGKFNNGGVFLTAKDLQTFLEFLLGRLHKVSSKRISHCLCASIWHYIMIFFAPYKKRGGVQKAQGFLLNDLRCHRFSFSSLQNTMKDASRSKNRTV